MKICPNCKQTYTDENLNFCLNDGSLLEAAESDPPPTVFMDPPRTTNPNFTDYNTPFGKTDQQIYQAPYSPPAVIGSQDQTLPIISLVLGVLGFCHDLLLGRSSARNRCRYHGLSGNEKCRFKSAKIWRKRNGNRRFDTRCNRHSERTCFCSYRYCGKHCEMI